MDGEPSASHGVNRRWWTTKKRNLRPDVQSLKETGQESGRQQSAGALRSCCPGQGAILLEAVAQAPHFLQTFAFRQAPALTCPH